VTHALEQVSDLLSRFGGHQSAAGFTVENSKREVFIDRLIRVVDESLDGEMLVPVQDIDACIHLDTINAGLMSFLDSLEPFGNQNKQPVFCSEKVRVLSKRTVGHDGAHLKMMLEQDGKPFDSIGFRLGELAAGLPDTVDVAYHLERNNYLGYETLQLRVVDIRPANSLEDSSLTEWIDAG
jgi:single-stranded-DNA-specific exonuclease